MLPYNLSGARYWFVTFLVWATLRFICTKMGKWIDLLVIFETISNLKIQEKKFDSQCHKSLHDLEGNQPSSLLSHSVGYLEGQGL